MIPPLSQELRQFHRIRFPIAERPTFLHEGKSLTVIDVSAWGLRYAAPGQPLPQLQDPIVGLLRFRRGTQIKIEGVVVRIQNDHVALQLTKEIPFSILLAEQRYLHARYPMWS
ncbi:MAG: PilZ domain-containing protein [Candidatus Competibacter sp.]